MNGEIRNILSAQDLFVMLSEMTEEQRQATYVVSFNNPLSDDKWECVQSASMKDDKLRLA